MMSVKKAGLIGAILFMLLLSGGGSQKETKAEEPLDEKAQNAEAQDAEVQDDKAQDAQPQIPAGSYDFTIDFAGDVNLSEGWPTTNYMDSTENGITDCFSPELIELMQAADVMCLNNEFTYSMAGAPLDGKMYTFRANPQREEVLGELGVDVVSLANNHTYDYGPVAMEDTFTTLENAGISDIGAGRNLKEAMEPLYMEIDGKTIAFVAASRAEKMKMTPQATEEDAGILRCYDTQLFVDEIKTASQNADFVIAYVHWGTEHSYELEEVQTTSARE